LFVVFSSSRPASAKIRAQGGETIKSGLPERGFGRQDCGRRVD